MSLSRSAFSTLALAAMLLTPVTLPTPAQAALNDDDLYCYEVTRKDGSKDVDCDTVGDLRAECKLGDPHNDSEECQDVNRKLVVPMSLTGSNEGSDSGRGDGPLTRPDLDLTTGVMPLN